MDIPTQRRIIENIILLWAMKEVPKEPKENIPSPSSDGTRQLTQEREVQLTNSLAFIAAATDDSSKVIAVCVEEDSDQFGMTIRLASNTGVLPRTLKGFKGLASTLERASLREKSRNVVRQDILCQILILDEPRILSRLRSKHAPGKSKKSPKVAPVDALSRYIDDPWIRDEISAQAKFKRIRMQSECFSNTFAKYEAIYKTDPASRIDVLTDLISQAFELDTEYLQTALRISPDIASGIKDSLPNAIRKLGQYRSVAIDLVDTARSSRYTIFGRIAVQALEEPITRMASITVNLLGFEAVLKRNIGSSLRQSELQHHSKSIKAARAKYH